MELDKEKKAWLELLNKESQQPLIDEMRDSLNKQIAGADTASELAAGVAKHLHALYRAYGQECLDLILYGLSPTVWKECGILVNPREIPEKHRNGVNVVADGSVPTEQWQRGAVTYYGDVRLTVLSGTAHVVNTKYPIQADGDAIVLAYGSDTVNAAGSSRVWLHDRARCEASGEVRVQAFDRSYVQAVVGRPSISAHDEAQFLVRTPRASVYMEGNTRGAIDCGEAFVNPVSIAIAGDSLLYINTPDLNDFRIRADQFNGLILHSTNVRLSPNEMCDLVVPRCKQEAVRFEEQRLVPMDVEKLKEDLQPYMPNDLQASGYRFFRQAKNEQEVGQFVYQHLPEMAGYGLSGDFLRSHFTKATLDGLQIHVDSRTAIADGSSTELDKHYFFGDQLIFADHFNGDAVGLGHTLVIANADEHPSHTYQFANAITQGGSMLFAHNNGQVLGMDSSKVYAYHGTKATIQDLCSCDAYDHSKVSAYDRSIALGLHQTQLALHDQSYAEVNGTCQAFIENCSQVVVRNEGAISYYDDGHISSEQLDIRSDSAKVHAYQELSRYEQAKETAGISKASGRNHGAGR